MRVVQEYNKMEMVVHLLQKISIWSVRPFQPVELKLLAKWKVSPCVSFGSFGILGLVCYFHVMWNNYFLNVATK